MRKARVAIAGRALTDLPDGQVLTCRFAGLSDQDRPLGSWAVEIASAAGKEPLLAPAPLVETLEDDALRG